GFRRVDGAHRDPARPCPGRGAGVALAAADLAVIPGGLRAGSRDRLRDPAGPRAGPADAATGTAITPRCLDLAAATLAVNGLDAELLSGPWFDPVAGRRFDRIVANPPFVVGTSEVGHSYRESGLVLDGASSTVVSGAPEHL